MMICGARARNPNPAPGYVLRYAVAPEFDLDSSRSVSTAANTNKKMALRLFHCLCLVLVVYLGSCAPAPASLNRSPSLWDYFLFVEQSPGGICYFHKGNNCAYANNVTNFTMHGIWATLNGTEGPNWCNPNATFSLDDIQEILPQMVSQWPNMKPETTFDSFWSHEWLKHGTCASQIDCMNSEKGFFSTVLKLHSTTMDFATILSSQGIYPSHHYTFKTDDFNTAFTNTIGVQPLLECLYSQETGQVLSQVSVCLRKDFSAMPCPQYVFHSSRHKCWDDEEVHYIPNF